MEPVRHPRIKICCIASPAEARLAVRCGADALGLVSAMPSGPGVIDEDRIAVIAAAVPPPVTTVLLTALREPDAIIAQQARCRTGAIQLVDHVAPAAHRRIRAALPGIRLIQVIHVRDGGALAEAEAAAATVDAVLLDSGAPGAAVPELGGTGRVHDWSVSRRIRERLSIPVFLAGGLRADNVGEAVATVDPFAVDVCSGVREDGLLNEGKLRAFMTACGRF